MLSIRMADIIIINMYIFSFHIIYHIYYVNLYILFYRASKYYLETSAVFDKPKVYFSLTKFDTSEIRIKRNINYFPASRSLRVGWDQFKYNLLFHIFIIDFSLVF